MTFPESECTPQVTPSILPDDVRASADFESSVELSPLFR